MSNQKKDKWENPFSSDYSRVVGDVDCLEEAANDKMLTNWCRKMEQISWQQEKTPGIVLIDEVDMHLHPNRQWKMVDALKSTFPMVQFIATTHSPIIVASCKEENLITLQLEDVFLDKPTEIKFGKTVKGWLVDSVLKEYMNSENRDPETSAKLKRLSEMKNCFK